MHLNKFTYDEIGNLKKDVQEGIAQIEWTVYGKIKEIIRTAGSTKKNLKFDYDAAGSRIAKHVYTSAGVLEKSEFYVRDAQGNVMSVYKLENNPVTMMQSFAQTEKHIYGNSRIGFDKTFTEMIGIPPLSTTNFSHNLGNKNYEGVNHLGNVLVTFTDKKIPLDGNNDGTIDGYRADVVSASDYYPFGVKMNGRSFNTENVRHQFNGKEFDEETETSDFGARMQDGDLGVWLSMDKLSRNYPDWSSYNYALDNPIIILDTRGTQVATFHVEGRGAVWGITVSHSVGLALDAYQGEIHLAGFYTGSFGFANGMGIVGGGAFTFYPYAQKVKDLSGFGASLGAFLSVPGVNLTGSGEVNYSTGANKFGVTVGPPQFGLGMGGAVYLEGTLTVMKDAVSIYDFKGSELYENLKEKFDFDEGQLNAAVEKLSTIVNYEEIRPANMDAVNNFMENTSTIQFQNYVTEPVSTSVSITNKPTDSNVTPSGVPEQKTSSDKMPYSNLSSYPSPDF